MQETPPRRTGRIFKHELDALLDEALRDTIERFEATGSPIITDGEQSKPSFATYPIAGLAQLAPDGVIIPFADGHVRRALSASDQRLGAGGKSSAVWWTRLNRLANTVCAMTKSASVTCASL